MWKPVDSKLPAKSCRGSPPVDTGTSVPRGPLACRGTREHEVALLCSGFDPAGLRFGSGVGHEHHLDDCSVDQLRYRQTSHAGSSQDILQVSQVNFLPDPPILKGTNVIQLVGTMGQVYLTSGSQLKYGWSSVQWGAVFPWGLQPFGEVSDSLCSSMRLNSYLTLSCPIQQGHFTHNITQYLSYWIPEVRPTDSFILCVISSQPTIPSYLPEFRF